MTDDVLNILGPDQLDQLKEDLVLLLRKKKLEVEEIEVIGVKGAGDFSTVFGLLIDGVHHTLKIYRKEESFQREIKHLRRQIPRGRFLLVWPASSNRFGYHIVIVEVPEGLHLHERMLSPIVAERFGDTLLNFHSLRFRRPRVSVTEILSVFDEARSDALAHADLFPDELGSDRLAQVLDSATGFVENHAQMFRIRPSQVHNDLWWANVIVAEEDVYLIDWENLGRGDYCRDLSFFRLMVYYERTIAPVSMWDEEPNPTAIDAFLLPILERYPETFADETFWPRYGLYAIQQAALNFSRAYYGDRRAARAALNIMKTGIRLFEDYALAADNEPAKV